MEALRVRVYNVGFGDAILVTVPDRDAEGRTAERRILVDVGNAYRSRMGGEGHRDAYFGPVVEDILRELAGNPVDLYVMTHEHYDHVQGLPYADKKVYPQENLQQTLRAQAAWFTGSADPDYYASHPEAERKKLALQRSFAAIGSFLSAVPDEEEGFPSVLMLINNGLLTSDDELRSLAPKSAWARELMLEDALTVERMALTTDDSVEWLRGLAPEGKPWYVHRPRPDHPGDTLSGKHPFSEAKLQIWAPEEDTSVYYRPLQPVALGVTRAATDRRAASGRSPGLVDLRPPAGVDAGAFFDLVDSRRRGFLDSLLAIDEAENNSSLVFLIEWRGWRLLFTADAEEKSWRLMDRAGVLDGVHFLKVSHHGSHNGMPPGELIDKVFPGESQLDQVDSRPRYSVVSTRSGTYSNNPTPEVLAKLRERSALLSTEDDLEDDGLYVELAFEGDCDRVTVRKG